MYGLPRVLISFFFRLPQAKTQITRAEGRNLTNLPIKMVDVTLPKPTHVRRNPEEGFPNIYIPCLVNINGLGFSFPSNEIFATELIRKLITVNITYTKAMNV